MKKNKTNCHRKGEIKGERERKSKGERQTEAGRETERDKQTARERETERKGGRAERDPSIPPPALPPYLGPNQALFGFELVSNLFCG